MTTGSNALELSNSELELSKANPFPKIQEMKWGADPFLSVTRKTEQNNRDPFPMIKGTEWASQVVTDTLQANRSVEGREGGGGKCGDRNLRPIVKFPGPTKTSIAVIAQTTTSIIAYRFSSISSLTKDLLVFVVLCNLVGYICCMIAILLSHRKPYVAEIFGGMGSFAAGLAFVLMIAMFLPNYFVWIVGLAGVVLLIAFVLTLKS